MTKIFYFLTVVSLLTLFSCKKERNQEMTVVRDCTGTYLRCGEKDYHVCNLEKVASYSSGEKVTATFKKTKDCTGSASQEIVCAMYHPNEGWIDVEKIK